MPKAKPISLNPLTFEEVIDVLIKAKPQKKQEKSKPKKRKKSL
jgi:hypothetical protein